MPFPKLPLDSQVMFKIIEGKRPDRPDTLLLIDSLWLLIEKCWHQDPQRRPGAMDVLKEVSLFTRRGSRLIVEQLQDMADDIRSPEGESNGSDHATESTSISPILPSASFLPGEIWKPFDLDSQVLTPIAVDSLVKLLGSFPIGWLIERDEMSYKISFVTAQGVRTFDDPRVHYPRLGCFESQEVHSFIRKMIIIRGHPDMKRRDGILDLTTSNNGLQSTFARFSRLSPGQLKRKTIKVGSRTSPSTHKADLW